jgi:hypothetical protein
MANNKKFAVKNGLLTQNIEFVSPNDANTINVRMLDGDTLSVSGDTGQLFSITDSQSGVIFAVNDISGVPSIEVDDTGTIRFAELFGNVLIGTAVDNGSKLQVNGNISATTLSLTATSGAPFTVASTTVVTNLNADSVDGKSFGSFVQGGFLYASNTATGVSSVVGTAGQVLRSGGTGAPTWTTVTNANTANTVVLRDGSGNFSAGTITAALSGNATTATTLQNARTIGGVSFNGSANINLPGVNAAGNQNTTGTAANVTGTVAIANGGTGATTAANARTGLGATTLGGNLFTLTNVAAIAFPRFNANNTVSSLSAADFRTAIGAGTGGGSVNSVSGTGTVSGITLTGTVTTSGNLTLGGTISGLTNANLSGTAGISNANLANSSVTVGSTAIALGASATTIAGLTSVTSTGFTTGSATMVYNATSKSLDFNFV